MLELMYTDELKLQHEYVSLLHSLSRARIDWVRALESEMEVYQRLCEDGKIDSQMQNIFRETLRAVVITSSNAVPCFEDFKHTDARDSGVIVAHSLSSRKTNQKIKLQCLYERHALFLSSVIVWAKAENVHNITYSDADWWAAFERWSASSPPSTNTSVAITKGRLLHAMLKTKGVTHVYGKDSVLMLKTERVHQYLVKKGLFSADALALEVTPVPIVDGSGT